MGVMRRGDRGFPCRVTPSHFVLDSRGRYDRLAVPGLLYFKPPRCSKNIISPPTVKFVIAWVHHLFIGFM